MGRKRLVVLRRVRIPPGKRRSRPVESRLLARSHPPLEQDRLADASRPGLQALYLDDETEIAKRQRQGTLIHQTRRLLRRFKHQSYGVAPRYFSTCAFHYLASGWRQARRVKRGELLHRRDMGQVGRNAEEVQRDSIVVRGLPESHLTRLWLTVISPIGRVEPQAIECDVDLSSERCSHRRAPQPCSQGSGAAPPGKHSPSALNSRQSSLPEC